MNKIYRFVNILSSSYRWSCIYLLWGSSRWWVVVGLSTRSLRECARLIRLVHWRRYIVDRTVDSLLLWMMLAGSVIVEWIWIVFNCTVVGGSIVLLWLNIYRLLLLLLLRNISMNSWRDELRSRLLLIWYWLLRLIVVLIIVWVSTWVVVWLRKSGLALMHDERCVKSIILRESLLRLLLIIIELSLLLILIIIVISHTLCV